MTEIDKYLESVRHQLKTAGDRDGEYFEVLCQEVDTYCVEHPLTTAEDIYACFGNPSSHVAEFLRNAPDGFAQQKLVSRKRFLSFLKVVFVTLAAAIIVLLSVLVADTWSYTHGVETVSPVIEGYYTGDPSALETY